MITEFFDFEGCAAVRLYYKDSNRAGAADRDIRNLLKEYGNYNITGLYRCEAFTPVFMTGNVEIASVVEYYTDMPFDRICA